MSTIDQNANKFSERTKINLKSALMKIDADFTPNYKHPIMSLSEIVTRFTVAHKDDIIAGKMPGINMLDVIYIMNNLPEAQELYPTEDNIEDTESVNIEDIELDKVEHTGSDNIEDTDLSV